MTIGQKAGSGKAPGGNGEEHGGQREGGTVTDGCDGPGLRSEISYET